MPETLETNVDKEHRKRFEMRAISHSVANIICKYFLIDPEFRKKHDGQFVIVSYESAAIYKTEEEAQYSKSTSYDSREIVVKMGGGGLGNGYALVKGCEVQWFNTGEKARKAIEKLPQERKINAIEDYFSTRPQAF